MHDSLLMGLFFSGLGGFFVVRSLLDLLQAIASESWPKALGEIVHSTVDAWYAESPTFIPVVRFRFTYAGVQYFSHNIKIGSPLSLNSSWIARQIADKYREGQMVTVYVCPKDPSRSVLLPGIQKAHYLTSAVGAILLGIGVKFLLSYFAINLGI